MRPLGGNWTKWFSRYEGSALLSVDEPKRIKYRLDNKDEHLILEAFHDFQQFKGLGDVDRWDQEIARNAGEYVRGVAATLPDGRRLNLAADLLEAVDHLLSMHITVEEIES